MTTLWHLIVHKSYTETDCYTEHTMKVLSCSLFVWPVERRQTRKPTQTNTWTLAFGCPGPVSIETFGAVRWNILEFRSSAVQHNLSVFFLFGWWLLYSVTTCIMQVWAVGCKLLFSSCILGIQPKVGRSGLCLYFSFCTIVCLFFVIFFAYIQCECYLCTSKASLWWSEC